MNNLTCGVDKCFRAPSATGRKKKMMPTCFFSHTAKNARTFFFACGENCCTPKIACCAARLLRKRLLCPTCCASATAQHPIFALVRKPSASTCFRLLLIIVFHLSIDCDYTLRLGAIISRSRIQKSVHHTNIEGISLRSTACQSMLGQTVLSISCVASL